MNLMHAKPDNVKTVHLASIKDKATHASVLQGKFCLAKLLLHCLKIKLKYSKPNLYYFLTRFTGKNCENDIVDCKETSCAPGATCIDLPNGFYCQCPFNLTGDDCRKSMNDDEIVFNHWQFTN